MCFSLPLVISILFVLRNLVTLFYITRSHSCSLSLIQFSLIWPSPALNNPPSSHWPNSHSQISHSLEHSLTLSDTHLLHIWPSPALNNPPSSHSPNSHSNISHSLEHSLTLSDTHLLHIWPSPALNNPPSSHSNLLSLQPLTLSWTLSYSWCSDPHQLLSLVLNTVHSPLLVLIPSGFYPLALTPARSISRQSGYRLSLSLSLTLTWSLRESLPYAISSCALFNPLDITPALAHAQTHAQALVHASFTHSPTVRLSLKLTPTPSLTTSFAPQQTHLLTITPSFKHTPSFTHHRSFWQPRTNWYTRLHSH